MAAAQHKASEKLQRKNEFSKEQLFKSICLMQVPTQLLKFGSSGKPGFRYFQLTEDLRSLTWQSKNKAAANTKVDLAVVKDIKYGQRTEKFKRNNRPDLEHLSFSLIYDEEKRTNESLDLVCKDEKEFQLWTKTMSTLLEKKGDDALMDELRALSKARDKTKTLMVKEEVGIQGANDVYAFGWGEWGQNGFGVTDAGEQPNPKLLETLLGKGVNGIACGWSHTLVLLETGVVMAYGNRTATGLAEDYFVPTPVANISEKTGVTAVCCGAFHCAALTSQGAVLTWGCNLYGQLGHGPDCKDAKAPTYVEDLLKAQGDGAEIFVDSIACGSNFTACLTEDGKVYTWGNGDHGALGHNDTKDQCRPKAVNDLLGMDVRKIAAGDGHMFACTDRETYGWGWNFAGQLGIQHTEDQYRPHVVEVLRGNQVESIACGAAHTVAVVLLVQFNSHLTYSWGSNAFGQLGQGKQKRVLQPTPIPKIGKQPIAEVQCGAMHTLVRTENGEVWSCGSGKYGQLGHGSTADVDEFKLIEGLKGKNARVMACGGENSAVLTARAWVEDSEAKECMGAGCKKLFSFVIRKHHCRNCGGIFCADCSSKKMAILKYGVIDPVRVCANCFIKLGGR